MFNFSQLKSLTIPEGKVIQIIDASGGILWELSGYKTILEVEKITSDTYAGETFPGEQFILLDIYPKTNGTVKVTYDNLTKTITDSTGVEKPNAQQVFFGTFNGISDSVATHASGKLTIEGDYYAFGCGTYKQYNDVSDKIYFYYCSCITQVYDFGNINRIPTNAFIGCTNLALAKLPDSVRSIGAGAFKKCTSLTSITIPNGVTTIEGSTFDSCENLQSVVMPNSVTSIDELAFNMCSSLVLESLPNALITIGKKAFNGCSSLVLASLPSGITSIGESAFYGCENMTISELPSGLTIIEQGTFQSCREITVKSLPSGVTSIGGWGFQGCRAIPSMIIPSGVVSIGKNAFNACNALSSVTFENTSGWYVTKTDNATSGINVDVTNVTNNVTLLKTTYGSGYYWYRS